MNKAALFTRSSVVQRLFFCGTAAASIFARAVVASAGRKTPFSESSSILLKSTNNGLFENQSPGNSQLQRFLSAATGSATLGFTQSRELGTSSTTEAPSMSGYEKLGTEKKPADVSEEEWKKVLSAEEYHVLREQGTERPFSGKYDKFKETGTYKCRACGEELFDSTMKYDSGCGWPAFHTSKSAKVERRVDNSHGMERTEVLCNKCRSHLGHVFQGESSTPTGERYCINSVCLAFDKEKK